MILERRNFKLCKPFTMAHGTTFEKECLFGTVPEREWVWEFTWSPSLGTNAAQLQKALSLPRGSCDSPSFWVAENHMSWFNLADELDSYQVTAESYRGREFGVSQPLASESSDDFIRVKCNAIIPVQKILDVADGVDVILDFNGSADMSELELGVKALRKSARVNNIFIEEPFMQGHIPRRWGCRRIFDRKNFDELLASGVLATGDICTLKTARNSFNEYLMLRDAECLVSIGQDLASPCGDAIMALLNNMLSTFRLDVLARDNVQFVKDDSNCNVYDGVKSVVQLLPKLSVYGSIMETSQLDSSWKIK